MPQCLYCQKPIRKIKNDFPNRKYHKKCYLEKQQLNLFFSVHKGDNLIQL